MIDYNFIFKKKWIKCIFFHFNFIKKFGCVFIFKVFGFHSISWYEFNLQNNLKHFKCILNAFSCHDYLF